MTRKRESKVVCELVGEMILSLSSFHLLPDGQMWGNLKESVSTEHDIDRDTLPRPPPPPNHLSSPPGEIDKGEISNPSLHRWLPAFISTSPSHSSTSTQATQSFPSFCAHSSLFCRLDKQIEKRWTLYRSHKLDFGLSPSLPTIPQRRRRGREMKKRVRNHIWPPHHLLLCHLMSPKLQYLHHKLLRLSLRKQVQFKVCLWGPHQE